MTRETQLKSNQSRTLLLLPGDGIGSEVISEARRVLETVIQEFHLSIQIEERQYGISAWKSEGKILPQSTLHAAQAADAVLFGAVGSPDYESIPIEEQQESDLLFIRKILGVYANIRPIKPFPALFDSTPFKPEHIRDVDLVFVRELNGGVYFGKPQGITTQSAGVFRGVDTQVYTTPEIQRIARAAFELARSRKGRVVSVDKANVMASGKLWRDEVQKLRDREYQDVTLSHMFADNCALQLVREPSQFDVILTDNLLGDILSDCAAPVMGSLGMVPSASLNLSNGAEPEHALYEPVHGSAPDIAGKGIANPIAAILSAAMTLRYSFKCTNESLVIERAIANVLSKGYRTKDLARAEEEFVGTRAMGAAIVAEIHQLMTNR